MRSSARAAALLLACAIALAGVIILIVEGQSGLIVHMLISTAVGILVMWLITGRSTTIIDRDLNAITEKVREYNRGNKSARVWGSNIAELRSLSEQINRMADEAEEALTLVRSEHARESGFISDVSHELRTPLASISGTAETLLLDGDMDEEDRVRFLNTIIFEANRMTRLANDLLTLQRIEGGTGEINLSRFSLETAVERAEATLEPLIEVRGVSFETFGTPEEVLGDIDRIQQIVVNLVDNATRAVGEGGSVWVEYGVAERWELGPLVHEPTLADVEEFATLSVYDDGPGIPVAKRAHIFDRFGRQQYSRDRKSGGFGLGLSIVKAITQSHGGAIDVSFGADEVRLPDAYSQAPPPEYGCCFTVYLPIPPKFDYERISTSSNLGRDHAPAQHRAARIRKRMRRN